MTAILFLVCYLYFGLSWLGLKICVFGFLLIGLIFMDEETGLLPREFTYPGIVLGLGFSWLASTDSGGTAFLLRLFSHPLTNTQRLSLLDSVAEQRSAEASSMFHGPCIISCEKNMGWGLETSR